MLEIALKDTTSGPYTGYFLHQWRLLGVTKSVPKKLKNNFFKEKFYFLKMHYFLMHITSLFSYT